MSGMLIYLYLNYLHHCYRNLEIALRILFTNPVTASTVERSFSNLKLIKTPIRSTPTDVGLSSLAMLSSDLARFEQIKHIFVNI